jgi:hypothetical protein
MAFIDNTAFEPRITNNRFEDLCNVTGMYQASGANADCSAGLLVKRNGQLPCEGFTGVYNENAWYMNAAAATDTIDTVIYACNTYDTQLLSNGSNEYFVGYRTLGLGVPAGRYGTFTRIDFDNQSVYRFGVGNLSAAAGDKTYFTIANGLLVPAASAPTTTGAIYFELRGTGNFVEGTTNSFGYVDVVACKVSTAA